MTSWMVLVLVGGVALWALWRSPGSRARDVASPAEEPEAGSPFDEPIEIPIGDALDLHYFPPGDTGELVDAYLEAAVERGFREVRIIHGRGRGVQRNRVRRHLERSAWVESFDDAPGDRGGWGATVVQLRARLDG